MRKTSSRVTATVTGAIAALLIAGCGTPAEDAPPETVSEAPQKVDDANESETPEGEDGDDGSAAEEEPAAEPEWVSVMTLSGNADKSSDTIDLPGGKVRVTYEFTDTAGLDMIVAGIYLLEEGTDLHKDGGIPVVMVTDEGSDETLLRKSAGSYYLHVTAANAEYTINVEVMEE